MRRRPVLTVALAGVLLALLAPPALAAETGTVDATVTVASPCITVGDPIDYGTLGFAPTGSVPSPATGTTTYQNCSSEVEVVDALGTDASGTGASWTLQDQQPCLGTTDLNEYRVELKDWEQISFALSSTVARPVDPAFAVSAVPTTLTTYLYMPCSGSSGAGLTMSFQIQLIAHF